jgi:pimeloyl-ACP methyl ester carboxylesterase
MGNTFVLVHGAWHGAWCWAAVIRQLDKLGDRAFALDLPGHGASNINRAEATLAAYIDSVVRFIEERGLSDVVLAGHSLGGITISGVAQRISRRLKRVIYVNAIVPRDGQRAIDTLPDADALAARLEQVRSLPDPSAEVDEQMFRSGYIQDATCRISSLVRWRLNRLRRCSKRFRCGTFSLAEFRKATWFAKMTFRAVPAIGIPTSPATWPTQPCALSKPVTRSCSRRRHNAPARYTNWRKADPMGS